MKIVVIIMIIIWAFMVYSIVTAPTMDDNGNIIKRKKDDNIK